MMGVEGVSKSFEEGCEHVSNETFDFMLHLIRYSSRDLS